MIIRFNEVWAFAIVIGLLAFLLVEISKGMALRYAGYARMRAVLGEATYGAIRIAYGPEAERILRSLYLDRSRQRVRIARYLRVGLGLGLNVTNAVPLGTHFGIAPHKLSSVASILSRGETLTFEERGLLHLFELSSNAHIVAALCESQARYRLVSNLSLALFATILSVTFALASLNIYVDALVSTAISITGALFVDVAYCAVRENSDRRRYGDHGSCLSKAGR